MGATGGRVGEATEDGLRFLLGGAAYLAPAGAVRRGRADRAARAASPGSRRSAPGRSACCSGSRSAWPPGRSGSGPGASGHEPLLDRAYVSDRGGVLGELLFEGSSSLFSDFGAHILFLFLMVGGTLLLTGASIAGIVLGHPRARGHHHPARPQAGGEDGGARPATCGPPEVEPVVHATHVEAPALDDAESRFPDLFAEGETSERQTSGRQRSPRRRRGARGRRRRPRIPPWSRRPCPRGAIRSALTPMGNARGGRDGGRRPRLLAAQAPVPQASKASRRPRAGADERVGRAAGGGARALRRRGPGRGQRQRPARDPLRAAAGARHQDVEGREHARRPRLRAGGRRRAHPRADPRQAGGGHRGAEQAPPDGAPGRRRAGGARGLVAAHRVARQGHRRQGDRHRPGGPAARARGRHDRLGQVGLRERDALLDPHARHARTRCGWC